MAWGIAAAQDKRILRFVYGDNFPPLSYAEDGVLRGSAPRVIEELLNKRLQLGVTHEAYPWARAQTMVHHGEADAYIGTATPDRLQHVIPTGESLVQARLSVFVSARNVHLPRYQKFQSAKDLEPLRLGSMLGNNWAKTVLSKHHVDYSNSRLSAFRMLQAGRIDALIDVDEPTLLAIANEGLESEIQMLPLVLATDEVKICVGKHSPLVARMHDIDEAIRSMRKDGSLARLYKP
jgi:polar amino acid transport system substrate-binding protein